MTTKQLFFTTLLLIFTLPGAGANPLSAAAASSGSISSASCNTVDFYIYNGTADLIDFEAANWSPGADWYYWYGYLSPGQEARFTLSTGLFEFYASDALNAAWYLDEMVAIADCSRAAVYIKLEAGQPRMNFRVFPRADGK